MASRNKPESENSPEEEKKFRILNTSAQTLYITLPSGTLVLDKGRSQDVPESAIRGNAHVKIMVRRGHIALFEY